MDQCRIDNDYKKLPDMTVLRKVNVRHKRISVARKTLIFAYFFVKLFQTLFEIKKLNLLCIGWCFFRLEGKTLHLANQIFARREKKFKKIKLLININFLSILFFSQHNRTCFFFKSVYVITFFNQNCP